MVVCLRVCVCVWGCTLTDRSLHGFLSIHIEFLLEAQVEVCLLASAAVVTSNSIVSWRCMHKAIYQSINHNHAIWPLVLSTFSSFSLAAHLQSIDYSSSLPLRSLSLSLIVRGLTHIHTVTANQQRRKAGID